MRELKIERLGEIRENNEGLKMKVIAYRSANDIDVQFIKSGIIQKNRRYLEFKKGNIKEIKKLGKERLRDERLGKIGENNDGLEMQIIGYRKARDIDVKFLKSKYISKRRTYDEFLRGIIRDRSIDRKRLGEVRINNKGLEMKIIAYRRSDDIDIEFLKSGYIVRGRTYPNFVRGGIVDRSRP